MIMRQRSAAGSDVVTQENPAGRDIVAVTDLALTNFINNRPITSDAEDCLQLVEIERYRPRLSVAKSRIVLVRNDAEVSYDIGARGDARRRTRSRRWTGSRGTDDPSPVWPVTRGDLLPIDDYTPLQEELPAIYGVGHAVLPDSAGTAPPAQACGSCRGICSSSSRSSRTSRRSSGTSTGSFPGMPTKTRRTSRGRRSTCRVCRTC